MLTTVHAKGFELTSALREHVERRVATALDRLAPEGARVTVTLEDVNGPRGGKDKVCTVRAIGLGVKADAVHAEADDLYAAIDIATDKLGRWATHAMKRAKPAFPDRTRRDTIRRKR